MLLHIGENVGVPLERVLFVLNAADITPVTRAFVDRARRSRRYMACTGKPKSYVVVSERGREQVYASMIASSTLEKRWRDEICRRYLNSVAVLTITEDEP